MSHGIKLYCWFDPGSTSLTNIAGGDCCGIVVLDIANVSDCVLRKIIGEAASESGNFWESYDRPLRENQS
ncbi:hypothetical protein QT995_02705 [Microcoleus sp. S36b_A3]|uniref:hypothetical protein n=1 Tax=unclassified Microcoleus TaxID=2642155 RepID=UPI002FD74B56